MGSGLKVGDLDMKIPFVPAILYATLDEVGGSNHDTDESSSKRHVTRPSHEPWMRFKDWGLNYGA
jgi:hypothetical protein